MKKRLFAIGDIHGCFDQLVKLVESEVNLKKSDQLIFLGDYIDRGSQSKNVIDFLLGLNRQGYNVVALRGNHEQMLLDALDNEDNLPLWLYNGGQITLDSFGIKSLVQLDPGYVKFFRKLPYYFDFENFLFVHAGFDNNSSDPFQDKFKLVWTSRDVYDHPLLMGKTIVHGHRPVRFEWLKQLQLGDQQVINVDTGCVYPDFLGYGHLTAIELYSMKLFTV